MRQIRADIHEREDAMFAAPAPEQREVLAATDRLAGR